MRLAGHGHPYRGIARRERELRRCMVDAMDRMEAAVGALQVSGDGVARVRHDEHLLVLAAQRDADAVRAVIIKEREKDPRRAPWPPRAAPSSWRTRQNGAGERP